jgi:hypothetical protein
MRWKNSAFFDDMGVYHMKLDYRETDGTTDIAANFGKALLSGRGGWTLRELVGEVKEFTEGPFKRGESEQALQRVVRPHKQG